MQKIIFFLHFQIFPTKNASLFIISNLSYFLSKKVLIFILFTFPKFFLLFCIPKMFYLFLLIFFIPEFCSPFFVSSIFLPIFYPFAKFTLIFKEHNRALILLAPFFADR